MQVIEILEEKGRNEAEEIFEKIMINNFPILMIDTTLHVQEAQKTPKKKCQKRKRKKQTNT